MSLRWWTAHWLTGRWSKWIPEFWTAAPLIWCRNLFSLQCAAVLVLYCFPDYSSLRYSVFNDVITSSSAADPPHEGVPTVWNTCRFMFGEQSLPMNDKISGIVVGKLPQPLEGLLSSEGSGLGRQEEICLWYFLSCQFAFQWGHCQVFSFGMQLIDSSMNWYRAVAE